MYFFFFPDFSPFFFIFWIFSLVSPFAHCISLRLHHQNLAAAQYGLRGPG